jgi:hypothetical protein
VDYSAAQGMRLRAELVKRRRGPGTIKPGTEARKGLEDGKGGGQMDGGITAQSHERSATIGRLANDFRSL